MYKYFFLIILLLLNTSCESESNSVFNSANPPIKTKVVVMGSSIAHGGYIDDSWIKLLARDERLDVVNLAYPGYFTRHSLPLSYQNPNHSQKVDVERNVEKALTLNPDIVIISFTVNDIANGVTIDEYIKNIDIITTPLIQNSIEVIITTTVPATPIPLTLRIRLKMLAEELKNKYKAVDIYTPLESKDDPYLPNLELYSNDYLHPNSKGHRIIFELIHTELLLRI